MDTSTINIAERVKDARRDETFVIYEDDEPYCRGFVFRV